MPTDQTHEPVRAATPISILACGGSLPLEVAGILRDAGRHPNIVSIAGMADADFSEYSHTTVGIGRIGALLAALRTNGTHDMIIAGHASRPDLRSLNIDFGFVRHIFTILSLTRGGDDYVLRKIAKFFEGNGLSVRSIAEVAPALLTPTGTLAGVFSSEEERRAIRGLRLIHELGPFDVGQALVIEGDQVLAIEGAEGTDGLLARLPAAISSAAGDNRRRILVKAAKPEQDLRVDLPTIGAATLEKCGTVGVHTIALEAGRSLIVSRADTLKQAAAADITIAGLELAPTPVRSEAGIAGMRIANLTRSQPTRQALRDARKGLQLLSVLFKTCSSSAALVSRENVLAISLNETLPEFLVRTEKLAQWGDRREKYKRNRTLALNSIDALVPGILEIAANAKVGGIAVLNPALNMARLDQLVKDADRLGLYVLSAE